VNDLNARFSSGDVRLNFLGFNIIGAIDAWLQDISIRMQIQLALQEVGDNKTTLPAINILDFELIIPEDKFTLTFTGNTLFKLVELLKGLFTGFVRKTIQS